MPSPRTACPPESGLCEAILMVPLDWASTGCAVGSASPAIVTTTARALSAWRIRKVLIRCPPQNGSAKFASGAIIAGLWGSSTETRGAGAEGGTRRGRSRARARSLGHEGLQLAPHLGVGWADGQRFVQERHGDLGPIGPSLFRRAGDQGEGVVGCQVHKARVLGEGLPVVGQGLGVAALLRIDRAQVRERRREIGLESERECEHLLGFPVLALAVERRPDIAGDVRPLWTEREGASKRLFSLLVALLAQQRGAEVVPAARAVRIDVDRPSPQRLGVLPDLGLVPGAGGQHEQDDGRAGQ